MKKLLMVLGFVLIATNVMGQKISVFDKNKDGQIDKEEYLRFLERTGGVSSESLDRDENGTVSIEELAYRFYSDLATLKRDYGDFPISLDRLMPKETAGTPGFFTRNGILLRGDYDAISIYEPATGLDAADPAIISYTNNAKDTVSIWTVQGALMRPFPITKEENNTRAVLVPSVYFNRKRSSNEEGEANSLTFRFGPSFEWVNGSGMSWNIRSSFSYATDFDFDSEVIAGEIDIEPAHLFKGMGVYRNIFQDKPKFIRYTWRIYGHFETGTTNDAGDNEALVEGSFSRLGARAELGFLFGKRFEIKSKAGYLFGLSDKSTDSDLIQVKSVLRLNGQGNIALNLEYQKGNMPLVQQEVENWTFGIGVKF